MGSLVIRGNNVKLEEHSYKEKQKNWFIRSKHRREIQPLWFSICVSGENAYLFIFYNK